MYLRDFHVKLIPNSCPIKIPILRRFKGELSNKFFHFQTHELHEFENEIRHDEKFCVGKFQ